MWYGIGSRLYKGWLGHTQECLLECVHHWGKRLILVDGDCLYCAVGFVMAAELRLWNKGKSEREWTLEQEALVERSNCSLPGLTTVSWRNGKTDHGS